MLDNIDTYIFCLKVVGAIVISGVAYFAIKSGIDKILDYYQRQNAKTYFASK